MPTLNEEIGKNIEAQRKRLKLSQEDFGSRLASSLGGKGWSRQAVWSAEHGRRPFSAPELLAIAAALDLTVPQVLETSGPVAMPSGALLGADVIDAMLSGRNDERDREFRLRSTMYALKAGIQDLNRIIGGLQLEVSELDAAVSKARGVRESMDAATYSEPGLVRAIRQDSRRIADRWRQRNRQTELEELD